MGQISDRSGSIALAYVVPLVAYVLIACYSFFGSAQRQSQSAMAA
jgi:fucose permease